MENDIKNLKERVEKIEQRNLSVESDKVWETSWTRKAALLALTYIVIALYLQAIDVSRPWVNAIVPALGFMISTLTMPIFKKWWLANVYNSVNTRK